MQTKVAFQWHHPQHLPLHLYSGSTCTLRVAAGVLMLPRHTVLCRAVRESQPSGTKLAICPEAAGLGWKPPLRVWGQECMVCPHPLSMRRTGFSAAASKNLMPSQPSRAPNHWIQWRCLWDMLWSVRKYKIAPVRIIKMSQKSDYSKW